MRKIVNFFELSNKSIVVQIFKIMDMGTSKLMRVTHRYLGFFLAGIMTVYALSGVVLIFRGTDFLKQEKVIEKQLKSNLEANELGKQLRIRGFEITHEDHEVIYFKNGHYNVNTGLASYTSKSLPFFLDKMTGLHKATTDHPLYWLNIFFGVSLLFFVVSSFWMFQVKSATLKKGLYYTAGGVVLTVILLFV